MRQHSGSAVDDRLNFSEISVLVVDGDRYSTGIVGQILRGFGLTRQYIAASGEAAKKLLLADKYDLMITESVLPDMKGAALIRWVRRHASMQLRTLPIVVITGYAHFSNVTAARDCGANSVVRKPISPTVLYDHIAWSAKTDRPFIEADGYAGPCRRFKYGEPDPGLSRRASDHYAGEGETLEEAAS
jgi:CheY-like chemotaxis protein